MRTLPPFRALGFWQHNNPLSPESPTQGKRGAYTAKDNLQIALKDLILTGTARYTAPSANAKSLNQVAFIPTSIGRFDRDMVEAIL